MGRNALTIQHDMWSFGVYTSFILFASLTIVLLSLISPVYIIVGFIIRGFDIADRNFISYVFSKLNDWNNSVEAYLTKDSSYTRCPYYQKEGQRCKSFSDYFESVGYKNREEYEKYRNIKCLFPVNCKRCERIHQSDRMKDRLNNK